MDGKRDFPRVNAVVCRNMFQRVTGVRLKRGGGPYRVTMTFREEK